MRVLADAPNLTATDQVARDWALFRATETDLGPETLRFWETVQPTLVLGRGGRVTDEVCEQTVAADGVPVLRRCSGGGAVLLGPGSLNYALVLSLVQRPELADIRHSYRVILGALAEALSVPGLAVRGTSDLVLDGRKVSGNAQRRGRRTLLHHGTLLYAFDATLAERYLKAPPREPPYRAGRPHTAFLGNLPLSPAVIRARLARAWLAD